MINWCMSSRREVLIIILVLLQRSLKSHIKMLKTALFDCAINVKCCSVDGGRTLFHPHPGGFDSSTVPTTGYLPSKAQKMLMPGDQPELVHVIRWLRGEVLHEFQPSLSYRMNVVWPNQFQLNSRYLCISQFQLRPAPQADPWALAFFVPWMANPRGWDSWALELSNPPTFFIDRTGGIWLKRDFRASGATRRQTGKTWQKDEHNTSKCQDV